MLHFATARQPTTHVSSPWQINLGAALSPKTPDCAPPRPPSLNPWLKYLPLIRLRPPTLSRANELLRLTQTPQGIQGRRSVFDCGVARSAGRIHRVPRLR